MLFLFTWQGEVLEHPEDFAVNLESWGMCFFTLHYQKVHLS